MVLRSPWLKGSLAARLGGDEFALVISDAELIERLPQVATRLVQELRFPRTSPAGDFIVSATIGCSELTGTSDTRHDLLQRADRALYRAKAQARGTFWLDTPQAA
jgi:diguanylate cyclase (GGDEF)-like protein